MADKYISWPVMKLKAELVSRGAVTTGKKVDLINRLIAYDRNQDFRPPPVIIPDPIYVGWPQTGYIQLRAEHRSFFTHFTREHIDGYFLYRLAGDRQNTCDMKALEKGKDMMDSNRVLACSILSSASEIFISGIVGAAMRNKVTYNYKLRMEKTGSPMNSHCECPAGKGPHATCKHIAAVFLMLETFGQTGKICVERSCTEDLQTFHRPKSYYHGAPVKVENIPSKRKFDEDFLSDPRPAKYRRNKGYTDFVRNMMVNYCSVSSYDMAMRYLHPKADIQAAQQDHDYLSLPYVEYWIDQALQITKEDACDLEKETRGQANNKMWFRAREWRLTASRFGEICSITCRRNIKKFCSSLLHPPKLNSPAVFHGKMYEAKAISMFEEKLHMKTSQAGLFVLPDFPYLGASPDAIVDSNTIVEVKCPYKGCQSVIKPGKEFPFLTFDDNGNIILKQSSKYYDQIQGQLFLSQRKQCYFIVYTFEDFHVETVELNSEYCVVCMLPKLKLFFEKHYRPFIASSV